jgi:LysR family glycine cleavage system transcriptional activator
VTILLRFTTLWRSWFAAAGLSGYEKAKHLHFNDSSLVITAVLRGQGVALSAPLYLRSQLKSQRLVRLGRTPITFCDYWLLESADRASASLAPHSSIGSQRKLSDPLGSETADDC